MLQCHAGVFDFLAVLHHGIGELHVVGLPLERRQAHVHDRIGLGVDATALVVFPFQPKRIEDLHLVMVHLIKAAVAPALSARGGLEG